MDSELPFDDETIEKLVANRTARLFAGKELLAAEREVRDAQLRLQTAQAALTKLHNEAVEIQRAAVARAQGAA